MDKASTGMQAACTELVMSASMGLINISCRGQGGQQMHTCCHAARWTLQHQSSAVR